jgi:hypothetical protein
MNRMFVIALLWALTNVGAQAGPFTCTQSIDISLSDVITSPNTHLGQCLRLHGMLSAAPKIGAMLTPASGTAINDQQGRIAIYFEDDAGPGDLATRSYYAEIVGRVLTCADIDKNAMESADRANAKEKGRPHGPNDPEIVYIGLPMGICHYRDDMLAILVSTYKLLPEPATH